MSNESITCPNCYSIYLEKTKLACQQNDYWFECLECNKSYDKEMFEEDNIKVDECPF